MLNSVKSDQRGEVTELLRAWSAGDYEAIDRLLPIVYDELRRIARRHLGGERPNHTLQPTELVHEAYFRLVNHNAMSWRDRGHFFAISAQTMRRILVDHARARLTDKRGGGTPELSLEVVGDVDLGRPSEVLALDSALSELAMLDQGQATIVELRFFGGLSIEETAEIVGCSRATVIRRWRFAKAWLYRELTPLLPTDR